MQTERHFLRKKAWLKRKETGQPKNCSKEKMNLKGLSKYANRNKKCNYLGGEGVVAAAATTPAGAAANSPGGGGGGADMLSYQIQL